MTFPSHKSPPVICRSLGGTDQQVVLDCSLFTSSKLRGERTVDPPSLQFMVSHATHAMGNWGMGNNQTNPWHSTSNNVPRLNPHVRGIWINAAMH